ncbi:MAG: sugar phosphate isomerase/epimerase family protein [Geminicoccaceae bacterium]
MACFWNRTTMAPVLREAYRPEIAIQLYSLRALGDPAKQLEAVRDCGFDAVELLQPHLLDTAHTAHLLDRYGLTPVSAHVRLNLLTERLGDVICAAKHLQIKRLAIPNTPKALRLRLVSLGGWPDFVRRLAGLATRLADLDLNLAYHNHGWELRRWFGRERPLDQLLDPTIAGALGWQADLGWLERRGIRSADAIRLHGDRMMSVHLKDVSPNGTTRAQGVWSDIGHGILPWQAIWRGLMTAKVPCLIIEHDRPSDPVKFMQRSRTTLLGLAT